MKHCIQFDLLFKDIILYFEQYTRFYVYIHICACMHAKLHQSCLILCDSMDCNPLSSSVYGILQARILEWDAILFSYMHTYIHKYMWKSEEVTQSCPTLCDPVDDSLQGSSVHGILQARILEWGAISFSRGSSQPRDWTRVSHITGRHYNLWATMLNHKSFSTYIHISGPTQKATGHDYAGWLSGHMSWF